MRFELGITHRIRDGLELGLDRIRIGLGLSLNATPATFKFNHTSPCGKNWTSHIGSGLDWTSHIGSGLDWTSL